LIHNFQNFQSFQSFHNFQEIWIAAQRDCDWSVLLFRHVASGMVSVTHRDIDEENAAVTRIMEMLRVGRPPKIRAIPSDDVAAGIGTSFFSQHQMQRDDRIVQFLLHSGR